MRSYRESLNFNALNVAMATDYCADLIEEVREFEFAWGVAYLNRDTAALERIMADDYTFTDPFGVLALVFRNIQLDPRW